MDARGRNPSISRKFSYAKKKKKKERFVGMIRGPRNLRAGVAPRN